jgi:hypothetical protein
VKSACGGARHKSAHFQRSIFGNFRRSPNVIDDLVYALENSDEVAARELAGEAQ